MSMPETRNWPRRKTNSCEPMSERLLPWTMTDTSGLSKQRSGAGGSSRRTSIRPSMGLGRISGAGRCRIRMSFRAARISSLMDRAEDDMRTSGSGCLPVYRKDGGERRGRPCCPQAEGMDGQERRGLPFQPSRQGAVFLQCQGRRTGTTAGKRPARPGMGGGVSARPAGRA